MNIYSFSSRDSMLGGLLIQEDVMIDVLMHHPVRSLVRFRCVSRSWGALFKSPTFEELHFLKCRKNDTVLLVRCCLPQLENEDVLSFRDQNSSGLEQVRSNLSIPFLKDLRFRYNSWYMPQVVHVLGPSKGLVCISYFDIIMLCNPALKEFNLLPPCPYANPKGYVGDILAAAFGHSCSNDWKVIMIRSLTRTSSYELQPYTIAHLYNSNTNCWRNIDGDAVLVEDVLHALYPCSELFLNGFCHWNASITKCCFPDIMLTFNISTEVFGKLEYPDFAEEYRGDICLVAINNCLSMICYVELKREPQLIDIWMMKEYSVSESWTKTSVIGPYQINRCLMPWKNDEWLLIESSDGQLATCAIQTDEIKTFQISGVERTLRCLLYKESLISIK